jgi:hypothetical protein
MSAILPPASFAGPARNRALARRSPARNADSMAKPLAKLVAVITPKRRWAQFSLATLLAVVTVLCVWLAFVVTRAHRQRDAVAALRKTGASVTYDFQRVGKYGVDGTKPNPGPKQLRRGLGEEYFQEVDSVMFHQIQISDNDLRPFHALPHVRWIKIIDQPITDAGMQHLAGLSELTMLELARTKVTDAGLRDLSGLHQLDFLGLSRTGITDGSLRILKTLDELQYLDLRSTQVTEAGVAELQKALPNCEIIR